MLPRKSQLTGNSRIVWETAEVPGQILKTFMTLLQGENAPNPQDVATAIDKIVATPAGSRPGAW